MMPLVN